MDPVPGTDESEAPRSADRQALTGLTVVSGPTAVGKGTIVGRLAQQHPMVWVSVSATTRPPRPGERDGEHYHFVDEKTFDQLIEQGELLEWAQVHQRHRYGTPREPALYALHDGRVAILEIDLQGARQLRRACPEATFVFIAAPSWEELLHRQARRGTETEKEKTQRLATARAEMAAMEEFDHVVINADAQTAVDELAELLGVDTPRPTT